MPRSPAILDETDRKILRVLQSQPDLTVRQIAEEVGLSHAPCWRRIQKMRADGVIVGRPYVLSPKLVGYGLSAFCLVSLKNHARRQLDEFESAASAVPEVVQCYMVTGTYDYCLRVLAASVEDYEGTIKYTLLSLPNVASINTLLTLKEVKNTPHVPV